MKWNTKVNCVFCGKKVKGLLDYDGDLIRMKKHSCAVDEKEWYEEVPIVKPVKVVKVIKAVKAKVSKMKLAKATAMKDLMECGISSNVSIHSRSVFYEYHFRKVGSKSGNPFIAKEILYHGG